MQNDLAPRMFSLVPRSSPSSLELRSSGQKLGVGTDWERTGNGLGTRLTSMTGNHTKSYSAEGCFGRGVASETKGCWSSVFMSCNLCVVGCWCRWKMSYLFGCCCGYCSWKSANVWLGHLFSGYCIVDHYVRLSLRRSCKFSSKMVSESILEDVNLLEWYQTTPLACNKKSKDWSLLFKVLNLVWNVYIWITSLCFPLQYNEEWQGWKKLDNWCIECCHTMNSDRAGKNWCIDQRHTMKSDRAGKNWCIDQCHTMKSGRAGKNWCIDQCHTMKSDRAGNRLASYKWQGWKKLNYRMVSYTMKGDRAGKNSRLVDNDVN